MLAQTAVARFATETSGVAQLGSMVGGGGYAPTAGNRYDNAVNQVLSYKGWNYVVVRKLSELIAASTPLVGQWQRGPVPVPKQAIRQRSHAWWNTTFGRMYQTEASDVEELDSHPLVELFERCNPEDTWSDLLCELNLYLELTGCAYL